MHVLWAMGPCNLISFSGLFAKFSQTWSMRARADRPRCPLGGSLSFAEHFLTFRHKGCSRLPLYFLCSHSAIGHVFQEPRFLGGG